MQRAGPEEVSGCARPLRSRMSEWLNTARGGLVLHVENEYLLVAMSLRYGQEQWNFCLDGPTIS